MSRKALFPVSRESEIKSRPGDASPASDGRAVPFYRTQGVRVDAVQIPDVVDLIQGWIDSRSTGNYISVTGMHGITESTRDGSFREVLNASALVVPDGMPLVWLARRRGHPLKRRVYGPELMSTFCRTTAGRYRHFLYGGSPDVIARLEAKVRSDFQTNVCGTYSPPFRDLTSSEVEDILARIQAARPDIIWVGLSTPKQERWMHEYGARTGASALVGVGAAFDFLAGVKKSAPVWMQERGLEWLFRLLSEPRRLWRRYILGGARFLALIAREELEISRSSRRV